jgi:hypothetical protein
MVKLVITEGLVTLFPLAWKVIGDNEAEGGRLIEMLG